MTRYPVTERGRLLAWQAYHDGIARQDMDIRRKRKVSARQRRIIDQCRVRQGLDPLYRKEKAS